MKTEDFLRAGITLLLMVGAIIITSLLFIPSTQDFAKSPATTGIFGMVLGFWFKELAQATAYFFGTTKAASDMNTKVADFAVQPGVVSDLTPNVTNVVNTIAAPQKGQNQ